VGVEGQEDFDEAFYQLLKYSIALEIPPLVIMSDMTRIRASGSPSSTPR